MKNEKEIKVCGDPHCEAIFHDIPKKVTKCNDCGGRLISINEKTYLSKYSGSFFQYDYNSMEYFRPILSTENRSIQFKLELL